MTRVQFLNDLYHHLYGLTRDQAEQHLTYYAEMLADRMEEGMTEEEAVAGMEDVETIARRIMEEEGLPYTPPEERPVTPPSYPDASRLGGGGGTRAYRVPRKRNWRKAAQVVLWVVAIAVALGAASRWVWQRRVQSWNRTTIATEQPVLIDSAAESPVYEYYDFYTAPYDHGYDYAGEEFLTHGEYVKRLEIQWTSGVVYVQGWSGDFIQVQEYSDTALNERTRMSCADDGEYDGSTVAIRYREGGGLGNLKGSKWLTVLVPDGMLGGLAIETVSADVILAGFEAQLVSASTTSGDVTAVECYTQTMAAHTVSGKVDLSGVVSDVLEIDTTSGDINGSDVETVDLKCATISGYTYIYGIESLQTAEIRSTSGDIYFAHENPAVQSIALGSVSGDITLSVPYSAGFTLDYVTTSGGIRQNGLGLERQGGLYQYNGGGYRIKVETLSGDLEIF